MSVPSVVFAEATWYGSLRGGLDSRSGSDAQFFDGGSRWGIKGSAEVSEGLTAVYRFEHKISTTNASQPGGRLAYAGLSGGFGSISLGQIWNAAYNHTGAITDKSYYFGNSTTGYRHGSALSYAHSTGPVSFQLDLISDAGTDTGQGIDKTEFGVTVAMGEIGKIALAHTTMRDTMKIGIVEEAVAEVRSPVVPAVPAVAPTPDTYWVRDADGPTETEATMITVYMTPAEAEPDGSPANVVDGKISTTAGIALIQRTGDRYHTSTSSAAQCKELADDQTADNECVTATAFVSQTKADDTVAAGGNVAPVVGTITERYHFEGTGTGNVTKTEGDPGSPAVPASGDEVITPAKDAVMGRVVDEYGYKNTHVAVEFNVGGMTPYLGHSTKKMNGAMGTKTKTTHYGVSGGLGDTGINFLVAARSVKPGGGEKFSPWLFNVSKNLGGGATVIFEHANDDDADKTKKSRVGLHVSF